MLLLRAEEEAPAVPGAPGIGGAPGGEEGTPGDEEGTPCELAGVCARLSASDPLEIGPLTPGRGSPHCRQ
jgi:hypothetical protein